jgi:hypothetical protein
LRLELKLKNKINFLVLLIFIGFGAGTAEAQFFGFSVDTAVDYTVAPDKVTGGTLGIINPIPFLPNFGYTQIEFKDETIDVDEVNKKLNSDVSIKSYSAFLIIPFPVVAVSLGGGVGELSVKSTFSGLSNEPTVSKPIVEAFTKIGLPFWNFLEFHMGIHTIKVSSKVDRAKAFSGISEYSQAFSSIDTKKDYTGTLTTVGLQIAF